ncbi:hypothetical protein [Nocardia asteroides]|uniref:NTP pyrophosphohydrolase MazG putative catalytic core domain-containing protein n=1 Tax=Nocardia asteroides NBRC 15531 TaxID=1110697 RepID=U5ED88_NOCAS|nr:hypothetical protein [Nocardia asteroides]UGT48646.1 hypothetical protein LT345_30080 [Nocardia asteroides]GAD83129.1 hypothetical protein NCAST_17_01110 [Nocardia asteroides NBRC 15531]SFL66592.1 hypothetical protein SAMN05444423_101458 [Nocardia asteroides]VEG31793.1 Uncharacterised protein [Nocardia asteroides]
MIFVDNNHNSIERPIGLRDSAAPGFPDLYTNRRSERSRHVSDMEPAAVARGECCIRGISSTLLVSLQKEVAELESERGTAGESLGQKCLLLTEEVFEVMKFFRVRSGIATEPSCNVSIGDELADVLFVSAAIANRLPVDLSDVWTSKNVKVEGIDSDDEYSANLALNAGLTLAERVLSVVAHIPRGTRSLHQKNASSFAEDLGAVLDSVDEIARVIEIDLNIAVNEKLEKDQLRLWR